MLESKDTKEIYL